MLVGASSASATTVQLLWTGSSDVANTTGLGTSTVGVAGPGVTLTLDLVFGIDANGLSAYGLDIEFDREPNLGNELDIVSFQEFTWANAKGTRNLTTLTNGISRTQESNGSVEGQLFGFEAFTLGSGPNNLTLTFARMVFVTNTVQTDGLDLFSANESDPFATIFFDNVGNVIPISTFSATVNLPEPHSIALLALAIGTLTAAGWKRS
jgi:hypothetical protein